jgi:hypothetical protein
VTEEREKLASLIERLKAASDYAAQCAAAQGRAPDVYDLAERRDAAEAALAEARENEPRHQIAALINNKIKAEIALATADAELARARQVRDMLAAELDSANAAIAMRRSYLREAVGRVLRADPAPAALLAEYKAAQDRVAELHAALSVISAVDGLSNNFWDAEPLARVPVQSPAVAAWRDALAALETDASALLPTVD